jgi:D-alanyl-D-alanine carboxypeptidase/D-alanyl-D-alanine-endopeptidase (penicillin-binding protein 4)
MQKVFIEELLPSPLPNRRGTLSGRMKSEKVHGRVFAKTGTLAAKGVSSLSGYCLGRNGHWYAFAILHEDMAIYEARIFQDRLCELLVK